MERSALVFNWHDVILSTNFINKSGILTLFLTKKTNPNYKTNAKNPKRRKNQMNDKMTSGQFDRWKQVLLSFHAMLPGYSFASEALHKQFISREVEEKL